VREKRLEKASGDPMYDSSVLQAIDEAQPLPVPEDLQLLYGGITITFKADDNGPGAR
jgi:TonB family protein